MASSYRKPRHVIEDGRIVMSRRGIIFFAVVISAVLLEALLRRVGSACVGVTER
jgi:hypothetical protein